MTALGLLSDAYESSLLTIVDLLEQRSQAGGAAQNIQEQLNLLERTVEPLSNPQLHQLVLQMRVDEQQFFNSGLQQYTDNLSLRVKNFKKLVKAASPTDLTVDGRPLDPIDLVAQAETYLANFKELSKLDQQIDTNTAAFLDITEDINGLTSHMRAEGAEGLARVRLRLATISRQTIVTLIFAALLALGLGVGTVIILTRRIIGPLNRLTRAAVQIGQGDYTGQVIMNRQDEFGLLADAFNAMTVDLRNLIGSLEEKVLARTQRLETVATLNEELVAILNVDQLLQEMVDQVRERFDYYHAHVYLLDEQREKLVVAAGTGEAGAEMKAKGHNISIDAPTSLVARAARSGQVVQVENVREAADWLPNPLLPNTYSELTVPIVLEGEVIGVLDVQEDEIAGLDESDASLLRSLANQVAVAIRNANLFKDVETALAKAHAAQERYTTQTWQKSKVKSLGTRYHYAHAEASGLDESTLTRLKHQAFTLNRPAILPVNGQEQPTENPAVETQQPKSIVAPITVQNKNIGALQLHPDSATQRWTEDDLVIVEAVIDQLAQSAENLRLFDETRRRAGREQLARQITDRIRASHDLEAATKTAAQELSKALNLTSAVVKWKLPAENETSEEVMATVPGVVDK